MIDYIGNELELFQHAVNWKKYFSSKIKPYIKGDILEVGAGFGANTKYLLTSNSNSWTFVEPDSILASQISEQTSGINISKEIIVGTIDSLVEDKKFDTIIYIDVLEHIKESVEEIEKIKSHLKTGGHLIILVPAFQFLFNEFDARIGHFRRYDKPLLRIEINYRLVEKKLFYLDSCGFLASLANKLILKKSAINVGQVKFWDRFLIRCSYLSDFMFLRKFGKSLIGIYQKK